MPRRRLAGFSGEWVEKRFDELFVRFATGLNPRTNFRLNNANAVNYYVTIKDFSDGKIAFGGCDRIDEKAKELIHKRSDLRKGDILFSSIGRVGDSYVVSSDPVNWDINESVFALRGAEWTNPYFLFYMIKSTLIQQKILDACTGSTMVGIKMGHLKALTMLIPPTLAEQQAIAAVLSDMDAEIAALEAKRAKYESIKQGMMQELLTGKTRLEA